MPVKTDDSGKRWVEMELLVPGTPEQVWQAMATGAGNTAWFTKTTIDERVGGAMHFDFGPMGESKAEVTTWEPPFRFGYVEREWGEGVPPLATEITITGRAGGRCVVRMVHSLFASTDDWDDQMEGFESGWPMFFEVLRVFLAHFAGQNAAICYASASSDAAEPGLWKRLTEKLDLVAAHVGEERATAQRPERLTGIVERVHQDDKQCYIMLRLTGPAPGIALIGTYGTGDGARAGLSLYLYGDDAEQRAAQCEPLWQRWFDETFARP